jgi:hypothetical protein
MQMPSREKVVLIAKQRRTMTRARMKMILWMSWVLWEFNFSCCNMIDELFMIYAVFLSVFALENL